MLWFGVINFGLLIFLDIDPLYKLLWFIALWLITVFKVNKDMNDVEGGAHDVIQKDTTPSFK